jgi:hypothetical protein
MAVQISQTLIRPTSLAFVATVFKGFAGNGKIGEFLFVAQW